MSEQWTQKRRLLHWQLRHIFINQLIHPSISPSEFYWSSSTHEVLVINLLYCSRHRKSHLVTLVFARKTKKFFCPPPDHESPNLTLCPRPWVTQPDLAPQTMSHPTWPCPQTMSHPTWPCTPDHESPNLTLHSRPWVTQPDLGPRPWITWPDLPSRPWVTNLTLPSDQESLTWPWPQTMSH